MGEILPLVRDSDFAALVLVHAPTIRARLRKVGLCAADVEDSMQDAFVKAWQLRDEMPTDRAARKEWFRRIAFNASCQRRRELTRTHYVGQFDKLARVAGESRSNAEAPAMLAEVLDRLPRKYHEIVSLHLYGYSIDEIAMHYGIPWTTAKSRWDRACVAMGTRGDRSVFRGRYTIQEGER
jgi:RNA polymerase sigma-70 factor (ECF subfamily)